MNCWIGGGATHPVGQAAGNREGIDRCLLTKYDDKTAKRLRIGMGFVLL